MSSDFVALRVREIASQQLGISEDEIQMDASISNDLGADKLDMIELVMAFEEEFEIEIADEEISNLKTLSDFAEFLSRRTM